MTQNDVSNLAKLFSLAEGYVKKLPAEEYCFVVNENTEQKKSNNFNKNNSFNNLSEIYSCVQKCNACKLCETRTNTVPGMGVQNPLVLVIGEGPGEQEDRQGLPFVGAAGQLLDKMLGAINLSRVTNTYIANIVKCRPPHNRDPEITEINACINFLQEQIKLLQPKFILLLGRIATETILNNKSGITRLHGNFFEYAGIPVMPTYHPSALLRNADLKRPAWEDLKTFKNKINEMGVNL